MKIIEFYKSFLRSQGFDFENDLLTRDDGEPAEFTYNKVKRRLALPTSAMIKKGMEDDDGRECQAFHPLCESVLAGESGTIRFLKKSINANLFIRSFALIDAILETAASGKAIRSAAYKKFLTEQICEGMKDPTFDERLVKSWEAVKHYVYGLLERDKKHKVTQLFIASDLVIDGVKFNRVANYRHMFEEESLDGTAMYFSVKLQRKQDKVIIHRLLTTVFGWYPSVTGSNDSRPYFGSLARGWAQYVVNYNNVVKGLRDHTPLRPLDDEWISQLDNMEIYDNVIQTLPYNTGPRSDNPERDTSAREFRIDRSSATEQIPTKKASDADKPNLDDPVEFFRARKQRMTPTNNFGNLSPAMQRFVEEHNTTNLAGTGMVGRISVVDAFGGERKNSGFGDVGGFGQPNSLSNTFGGGHSFGGGSSFGGSSFGSQPQFGSSSGFGSSTSNPFASASTSPFKSSY